MNDSDLVRDYVDKLYEASYTVGLEVNGAHSSNVIIVNKEGYANYGDSNVDNTDTKIINEVISLYTDFTMDNGCKVSEYIDKYLFEKIYVAKTKVYEILSKVTLKLGTTTWVLITNDGKECSLDSLYPPLSPFCSFTYFKYEYDKWKYDSMIAINEATFGQMY